MKKIMMLGLVMLLLISSVMADEMRPTKTIELGDSNNRETIRMKTTDFFIVQFQVDSVNDIDLRNCVPLIRSDSKTLRDTTVFKPDIFNLDPDASEVITARLDNLPVGYYQGEISVKCERYYEGEFVDVEDIIDPEYAPKYDVLVSPPGEGQDYVFIPAQSYQFISDPGQTKSAGFKIANTGSKRLDVSIMPEAEYQNIILIEPRSTTISPEDTQEFQITVKVPENFEGFETNLTIQIGDYTEDFLVMGNKESFKIVGSAVSQSVLNGTVSAGNVKIPTWAILIVIVGAGVWLLRDEFGKGGKKR